MQIIEHLSNIIRLIGANPVVSVVAPTGSGKSVGIPAAIGQVGSRCFVTVPTRTAAYSLASYQRSISPNVEVGYAAEGNVHYTESTKIAYVTGGHMRRKLLAHIIDGHATPITFTDVLMVDEIHSGSIDNSIIIALWQLAARSRVQVPRLVLATATPGLTLTVEPAPALYTVTPVTYPVEIRYMAKEIDPDDATLYEETAKLAADVHRSNAFVAEQYALPASATNNPNRPGTAGNRVNGDMLIFAPGSGEVESIIRLLTEARLDKVIIVGAFGAMEQEQFNKIYAPPQSGWRKIVVTTNVAESAITIPDIAFVIDTMVEKRAETSMTGGTRLSLHRIAKDSAKQRAGRTGRTRPGICYRMMTEQRFLVLEENRPAEITRVPIYGMVMELLNVGLLADGEFKIPDLDVARIDEAISLLKALGMVTTDGQVTDLGRFVPTVPLGIRSAAVLWYWLQNTPEGRARPPYPGVVAVSLIDCYGPSYYWVPRRQPEESVGEYNQRIERYRVEYFSSIIGRDDLTTALNMWNRLMEQVGGPKAPSGDIKRWAQSNSINNKKLREVLQIVEKTIRQIAKSQRVQADSLVVRFTTAGLVAAIKPILEDVYGDQILPMSRRGIYVHPKTREDFRLDNKGALNQLSADPPPYLIAVLTTEIRTGMGVLRLISFAVETAKAGIYGAGPKPRRGQRVIHRVPTISTDYSQSNEEQLAPIDRLVYPPPRPEPGFVPVIEAGPPPLNVDPGTDVTPILPPSQPVFASQPGARPGIPLGRMEQLEGPRQATPSPILTGPEAIQQAARLLAELEQLRLGS
jgi:HrpA-like RNA helicase